MAAITLNVRLPVPQNEELPHLTRFQSEQPPAWAGVTLLDVPATTADTVAQLKRRVAGALRRRGRRRRRAAAEGGRAAARGGGRAKRRAGDETRAPPARRRARGKRRARCQPSRRRARNATPRRSCSCSADAVHLRVCTCACVRAERTGGALPELLRKGGAAGKGVVLEDSKTLAECGLDYSMGVWEARQRQRRARGSVVRARTHPWREKRERASADVIVICSSPAHARQHLWVDSQENQARFREEYEKARAPRHTSAAWQQALARRFTSEGCVSGKCVCVMRSGARLTHRAAAHHARARVGTSGVLLRHHAARLPQHAAAVSGAAGGARGGAGFWASCRALVACLRRAAPASPTRCCVWQQQRHAAETRRAITCRREPRPNSTQPKGGLCRLIQPVSAVVQHHPPCCLGRKTPRARIGATAQPTLPPAVHRPPSA
jgi:hypothetical protein